MFTLRKGIRNILTANWRRRRNLTSPTAIVLLTSYMGNVCDGLSITASKTWVMRRLQVGYDQESAKEEKWYSVTSRTPTHVIKFLPDGILNDYAINSQISVRLSEAENGLSLRLGLRNCNVHATCLFCALAHARDDVLYNMMHEKDVTGKGNKWFRRLWAVELKARLTMTVQIIGAWSTRV
jgi:hypothetical protein